MDTEVQHKIQAMVRLVDDLEQNKEDVLDGFIAILADMLVQKVFNSVHHLNIFDKKDSVRQFWQALETITKRSWLYEEMILMFNKVKELKRHQRKTIPSWHRVHMELHSEMKCFLCRSKKNLEIHHKMPVSKGGKNELSNYEWCCRKCNATIGNQVLS